MMTFEKPTTPQVQSIPASALPAPALPVAELAAVDWHGAIKTALGSAVAAGVVSGGIYLLGKWIEEEQARAAARAVAAERNAAAPLPFDLDDEEPAPLDDADDEETEAAALLGVEPGAGADEIRAALRARMTEARRHPDQGGDLETAQRLIAAKNLLIERCRETGLR